MKEIIERVETMFSEIGYDIFDRENSEEMYQASYGKNGNFNGSFFIENGGNFLELAYTYTFDINEENFLREQLESMMDICYEYGTYFNILKSEDEIHFSVFGKLYFSGLNIESLGDTLDDFIACNDELGMLFEIGEDENPSDSQKNIHE
jgi:hypothetical protein